MKTSLRAGGEPNTLYSGWHDGYVVKYFTFEEASLMKTTVGLVPLVDIRVCFNINPDQPEVVVVGAPPPQGLHYIQDPAERLIIVILNLIHNPV